MARLSALPPDHVILDPSRRKGTGLRRSFAAAVAVVWLALGSVLLGALPAAAGDDVDPPVASYSFAPAEVSVEASAGNGSEVVVGLYSVADGTLVEECPAVESESSTEAEHPDPVECVFSALDPGAWLIRTEQGDGDGEDHGYDHEHGDDHDHGDDHQHDHGDDDSSGLSVDDVFVIPAAPAIDTAQLAADGSVAIGGTGVAGDAVEVEDAQGLTVCDVVIDESGRWGCSAVGPYDLAAAFTAMEENTGPPAEYAAGYRSGGLSAWSAPVAVAPPVVVVPTLDPNWSFTLGDIDRSAIRPGASFSVTAGGLPPGLHVLIELHSDPVTISSASVGADGGFAAAATIPLDVALGQHRIAVTLSGAGISAQKDLAITIVGPPASPPVVPPAVVPVVRPVAAPSPVPLGVQPIAVVPVSAVVEAEGGVVPSATVTTPEEHAVAVEPEPEAHVEAEGEHADEHAAESSEGEVDPNILTDALQPIQHVLANPATVASAFSIGLVLVVLAAAPAHLLNATITEQYQRFSARAARFRIPRWYVALSAWMARQPLLAALVLITITSTLFGVADPHFGFNDHSLRLLIACAVALFVVAFVSSWLTGLILKVRWSVVTRISFRPLGLILTLIGVLVSRVLEFSPGFLVGLVLGLSMAAPAMKQHAWRAVAIRSTIIIVFGIAAWWGFSSLTVHGEPHDFLGALIVETCVAITTEGIVMLLIDLLPIRLLSGEVLFAHSKLLWGALYLVATVMFIVGVVAWEGHWRELGGSLWLWISVVGVFAIVCVAIYLYFRFWAPPLPEETVDEEEPLARIE